MVDNQTVARVYKLVQQDILSFSLFLPFSSFSHFLLSPFLPLLPHCTGWTCDSSLSVRPPYSNEGWPRLHVSLPSFWVQTYSSRHAWRHKVAKGFSPSDSFELFLSLKWHHRGLAWLMSPRLYTLFYAECQLNIWKPGAFHNACGQVWGYCGLIGNQLAIQPFQLSM